MRLALAAALLIATAAHADAFRRFQRNGGASSAAALRLLSGAPALSEQCTGTLSGVTVSRSSSAYCTKSDGTLVSLSSNTVRVESDGLLREPAATNTALRSEEFDNASWSKLNSGASAPVVTANASASPAGTTTAESIAFGGTSAGTDYSFVTQSFTGTAAAWSASVYLKGASASGTVYLFLLNGSTYHTTACAYTSSAWSRCTVSNKTLTAAGWFLVVGIDRRDAQQANQSAQTVYVWGAQVELGTAATSYVATAGTQATRSADVVSISKPATVTDTAGCIGVTVKAKAVAAASRVVGFGASNGLTLATTTTASAADGTNTATATLASTAVNRSVRLVSTWGSALTATESGQEVASTDYDGSWLASTIYLGSDSSGTTGLTGHLLNLQLGKNAGACQ